VTACAECGGNHKATSRHTRTLPDLAALGLTYRQLDFWVRKGYLSAATPGSGKRRTWSDDELAIAAHMVRLISCGFTVARAAEIARGRSPHGACTFLTLGDGIHLLIYENQPQQQEEAS
jgi:DNA-binding transcriptional MerR regulator